MKTNNSIGLDKARSAQLAGQLNDLLANYQVLYQNTRSFHWNIKGSKFFQLHEKFEELYNDLQEKIDEIAERILTLGETPLHTYQDYLNLSAIKPAKNMTDGKECVKSVLDSFTLLLSKEREIVRLAGEMDDEGTSAMVGDYIRQKEKLVWMLNAFLG